MILPLGCKEVREQRGDNHEHEADDDTCAEFPGFGLGQLLGSGVWVLDSGGIFAGRGGTDPFAMLFLLFSGEAKGGGRGCV